MTPIRKALATACEPFKHETEDFKVKLRPVYKVAIQAIELAEKLQAEINAYKAPKLDYCLEKPDVGPKPDRRFYGTVERIRLYLAENPHSREFELFLKYKKLTLAEAVKMAEGKIDETA